MRKDIPMLFSTPMVTAVLAGKKNKTRRVVKPQPRLDMPWPQSRSCTTWLDITTETDYYGKCGVIPYAKGMRIWVKETYTVLGKDFVYRAPMPGDFPVHYGRPWKPSIFMPRKASRITLEIVSVKIERLQSISKADVIAEGTPGFELECASEDEARRCFESLWDKINGSKFPWRMNPFVYVIEFKKL